MRWVIVLPDDQSRRLARAVSQKINQDNGAGGGSSNRRQRES